MVMAQSLFKTLKLQQPERSIDVSAPEWSVPLLNRMPEISQNIPLHVHHGELALTKRYQLGRMLRGKYQQAIVLPRSLKASLLPFFAKIPVRTGFTGEQRYGLINDRRPFDPVVLDQTVKRFVALGLTSTAAQQPFNIPYPRLAIDPVNQANVINRLRLNPDLPTVALLPGAEYGPAKQWPLEYYAHLAKTMKSHGYQVIILGSEKDRPAGVEIAKNSDSTIRNLCGRTLIIDVIDLLNFCRVAVANDSGLMHIAAAVNCPVVAIYGSSTPKFTPPLTEKAAIAHLNLSCSPCFKRRCPLKHLNCLRHIHPEYIEKMVFKLLQKPNSSTGINCPIGLLSP